MALQVWLPLNKNGDLKNQGLADVTVTNNGATYNSNGKIGGCYKVNGVQLSIPSASYMEMKSGKQFSFACWAKGASNGWFIACSGWEIQFLTGHINVYPGGSSNNRDSKFNGTTATDLWRHIAFTWDGSNLILYVDGNALNTSTFDVSYNISSNINFCYQGERYLNDVRIYDHCLSPKEVKEISKGLVLHYPLNDSATALKSKSTNVIYNLLVNLNPNGYTYTFASNNSSYYTQIANLNTPITTISGHKYYTRAYISRNISGNNAVYYQLITASGGKAIGTGPANGAPDGYYSNVVTLTGATSNSTYLGIGNYNQKHHFDAGDTVTLRDIVCIDLTVMFGVGNEPTKEDFEKLNLHMLTAYNAGTTMNLKEPVYDSSGYNNNGTITGTLTTNTDTPRYDKCTKYMDSASSIGIGNLSTLVPSGVFTFNIWFKRITGEWSSKDWETIIGGPSGFELLTKRISTNSPVIVMYSWNNNAENDIPYELDKWNMLTMVRTSAGTIFYLNGDQKKTGGAGSIPSGNYFIGSWSAATKQNFRGMLSDARIYSTALSEDDIKELYNTAAFVDNHGNVGCYLFYEDGANSKELLPIPTSGVTFNSDGSYLVNGHTWPPTDYIPINPSGKTYYYDIEYSNLNSGNHLYIGFEKYDANKASGSNSECLYLVSTTSVSNHIRVTGTIGLATANGTAAAFTKLRILNNWDRASGTNQAIIHHISLKEVSTLTLNQINKQGLIKSDAFIEGDSATISKHGNVTANQLIEI